MEAPDHAVRLAAPEPGEIQLWVIDSEEVHALGLCLALLDDEERAARSRIVPQRPRREAIVSRAFLRMTLSRYADVEPQSWRFGVGEHGRPVVVAPTSPRAPHFNVSHSQGLVVCAVGAHAELGVDVEDVRRTLDLDGVARLSFSSAELAAWRALSGAEKIDRFFELWTAKEAYLKARGAGLTLPLDGFSIAFGAGAPTIAFEPGFADDAGSWAFAQAALGPELRAAVAVRWSGCLTVCVSHVDPGTLSPAARLGPG